MKDGEMGSTCSTHGVMIMRTELDLEDPKKRVDKRTGMDWCITAYTKNTAKRDLEVSGRHENLNSNGRI
jgi:hypothetical protein